MLEKNVFFPAIMLPFFTVHSCAHLTLSPLPPGRPGGPGNPGSPRSPSGPCENKPRIETPSVVSRVNPMDNCNQGADSGPLTHIEQDLIPRVVPAHAVGEYPM